MLNKLAVKPNLRHCPHAMSYRTALYKWTLIAYVGCNGITNRVYNNMYRAPGHAVDAGYLGYLCLRLKHRMRPFFRNGAHTLCTTEQCSADSRGDCGVIYYCVALEKMDTTLGNFRNKKCTNVRPRMVLFF